jgi:hypothetical protein
LSITPERPNIERFGRAARTFTHAGQEQLRQSYKKLIGLTQGVKVQADAVLKALKDGQLVARCETFFKVVAAETSLKHYLPQILADPPGFPKTPDFFILKRVFNPIYECLFTSGHDNPTLRAEKRWQRN